MVGCKCWHASEKVSGSKEQNVSRKEHTELKLALHLYNVIFIKIFFFYFEEKKRVYLIGKEVY